MFFGLDFFLIFWPTVSRYQIEYYYPDFNHCFFFSYSKQPVPRANSQFYRVNFDNSTQNTAVELNTIESHSEYNTAVEMNSQVQ